MPINNKGRLNLSEVVRRQVDKDWPAANTDYDLFVQDLIASGNVIANGLIIRNIQVSDNILTGNVSASGITANTLTLDILRSNLVYTRDVNATGNLIANGLIIRGIQVSDNILTGNITASGITANTLTLDILRSNLVYTRDVIANGNLIANGLIIRNIEVSDNILTGNITASTITSNTLVLDVITANTFNGLPAANISLLTTDDLNEGTANLYFTLARARGAYTEGQGIAISANGVISTRGDDTGLGAFNSGINLAANLKPSATYANIKTFPAVEGNSFIVFSFLATNRSSNISYLSARVRTNGNTVMLANLLKLPPNSSTEIFRKPQVFKPNDSIEILSLNQNQTPAANLVTAYISYQGSIDATFNRSVLSIPDNQAYMLFQSAAVTSIVESLNLVNLGPNVMPVDAYITNNNNELVTYLVSNLVIPPYTSVEICEYPKALLDNDKIWIQKWDNPREMSVFVSSKVTSSYNITPSATAVVEGDSITFDLVTRNVLDGTVLYYEIQGI